MRLGAPSDEGAVEGGGTPSETEGVKGVVSNATAAIEAGVFPPSVARGLTPVRATSLI